MEPLPGLDDYLSANDAWMRSFTWGDLDVRPRRHLAILTCMDSRYTAQRILGMQLGDTHVIRNAGGRVTEDVIRSLVLSAHVLGTRGCVVVHHTKCGLHRATNDAIYGQIREATGEDASAIDFLPFDDLAESVREDVARLRSCALLPEGYQVLGFIYDVETGRIQPVE